MSHEGTTSYLGNLGSQYYTDPPSPIYRSCATGQKQIIKLLLPPKAKAVHAGHMQDTGVKAVFVMSGWEPTL